MKRSGIGVPSYEEKKYMKWNEESGIGVPSYKEKII